MQRAQIALCTECGQRTADTLAGPAHIAPTGTHKVESVYYVSSAMLEQARQEQLQQREAERV